MISFSSDHRKKSGINAGDDIEVGLRLDTEERVIPIPAELAEAFKSEAKARENFEKLSNSKKQRLAIPIEKSKSIEAKIRNVNKALDELKLI